MMLLHMYQIFSSLRGHLHFSVQFSLHFHGNFFLNDPLQFKCFQTLQNFGHFMGIFGAKKIQAFEN